jgi:MFS family permease
VCPAIPANVIDYDLARGLDDAVPGRQGSTERQPSGLQVLVSSRPLLIFAVCAVLFHLANAAMLPLVGQKLALPDKNLGTSLMAACIVAAQLVMVPMAMLVGATADRLGRKPLFLAGLLVLPIRGVLYTISDNPYWLVSVQHLDGIGAGIYCDLSYHRRRRGSTLPRRGDDRAGHRRGTFDRVRRRRRACRYSVAFITLGGMAAIAAVMFFFAMPETQPPGPDGGRHRPAAPGAVDVG